MYAYREHEDKAVLRVGVACNGDYVMILEMPTPKDLREAVDKLVYCQNATSETLIKVTIALEQLAVWMKMQEGINITANDRLNELERKTDMIMKATRFSPKS